MILGNIAKQFIIKPIQRRSVCAFNLSEKKTLNLNPKNNNIFNNILIVTLISGIGFYTIKKN